MAGPNCILRFYCSAFWGCTFCIMYKCMVYYMMHRVSPQMCTLHYAKGAHRVQYRTCCVVEMFSKANDAHVKSMYHFPMCCCIMCTIILSKVILNIHIGMTQILENSRFTFINIPFLTYQFDVYGQKCIYTKTAKVS